MSYNIEWVIGVHYAGIPHCALLLGVPGGGGGVMHSEVSWPYGWNKLDMTVQMDSMDVDDMSMKCH